MSTSIPLLILLAAPPPTPATGPSVESTPPPASDPFDQGTQGVGTPPIEPVPHAPEPPSPTSVAPEILAAAPSIQTRKRVATGFTVSAGVFGVAGVGGLLLAALPTLGVARVADGRANKPDNIGASDARPRARASHRRRLAWDMAILYAYGLAGSAAIGAAALAVWPWASRPSRSEPRVSIAPRGGRASQTSPTPPRPRDRIRS